MRKKMHMTVCLEGALKWSRKINFIQDDNGRNLTDKEARAYFKSLIAEGYRVMPITGCEGFDPIKGCPGHPIPEAD